jgi:hypothetical protein
MRPAGTRTQTGKISITLDECQQPSKVQISERLVLIASSLASPASPLSIEAIRTGLNATSKV